MLHIDSIRRGYRNRESIIAIYQLNTGRRIDFRYRRDSCRTIVRWTGASCIKFHSIGNHAITQHRVIPLVDQCAAVCKRRRYSWHNYHPRYRFSILAIATIADRWLCPRCRSYRTTVGSRDRLFHSECCASPYVALDSTAIARSCVIFTESERKKREKNKLVNAGNYPNIVDIYRCIQSRKCILKCSEATFYSIFYL